MRFLADESCDYRIVQFLRRSGYNVTAIAETTPKMVDEEVASLALKEKRILITEDKDFGQLVYAYGYQSLGVILLRFPSKARNRIAKEVLQLIEDARDKLIGSFVVVQPGKTRITRLSIT